MYTYTVDTLISGPHSATPSVEKYVHDDESEVMFQNMTTWKAVLNIRLNFIGYGEYLLVHRLVLSLSLNTEDRYSPETALHLSGDRSPRRHLSHEVQGFRVYNKYTAISPPILVQTCGYRAQNPIPNPYNFSSRSIAWWHHIEGFDMWQEQIQ